MIVVMPFATLIPAAVSVLALSVGPTTPGCELYLSVQKESGTTVSTTVLCEPVAGTHPSATMVCDALSKTDGDFAKITPAQAMFCPDYFAPVTVTAKGNWHGQPVHFAHTYSNQCFANAAMGKIFDF